MLEGPFNGTEMNTNLNAAGLIPMAQPYYSDPLARWYYTGTESVSLIPNPDIIDWIVLELRDASSANLANATTIVDRKAAFILKDGSVVATDGVSMVKSYASFTNNAFIVIWHRNHLGVLSANPMSLSGTNFYSYDFTTSAGQAYLNGQKDLGGGVFGMYGADGYADQNIDNLDYLNVWMLESGTSGYKFGDFNLDTQVDNKDKNDLWVPNQGKGTQVPN